MESLLAAEIIRASIELSACFGPIAAWTAGLNGAFHSGIKPGATASPAIPVAIQLIQEDSRGKWRHLRRK